MEFDLEDLGIRASRFGLELLGINETANIHWNLNIPELIEHACRRDEGRMTADGAFVALTGEHSGRSPNDRFVVDEDETNNEIAWGEVNKPISKDHFLGLKKKI